MTERSAGLDIPLLVLQVDAEVACSTIAARHQQIVSCEKGQLERHPFALRCG
jgi:hypothetical protein